MSDTILDGAGDYLNIARAIRAGMDKWASKPHNKKWLKRIERTPIFNDLMVNITEAVIAANTLPSRKNEEIGISMKFQNWLSEWPSKHPGSEPFLSDAWFAGRDSQDAEVEALKARVAELEYGCNNTAFCRDEMTWRKVIETVRLEGAFDLLSQIRSFRKRNPMDAGAADTLEFIGNLYYEYEKKLAANRAAVERGKG